MEGEEGVEAVKTSSDFFREGSEKEGEAVGLGGEGSGHMGGSTGMRGGKSSDESSAKPECVGMGKGEVWEGKGLDGVDEASVAERGVAGRGEVVGSGGGGGGSVNWRFGGPESLCDRIKLSTASKKDSGTSCEGWEESNDGLGGGCEVVTGESCGEIRTGTSVSDE